MPKMRSHSSSKQRFKVTGRGKVMRRRQGKGHLMVGKRPKRVRRIKSEVRISREDSLIVRKLLRISVNNKDLPKKGIK